MLKALFDNSRTTKADVLMALAVAIGSVWKAYDTVTDYKEDQKEITK